MSNFRTLHFLSIPLSNCETICARIVWRTEGSCASLVGCIRQKRRRACIEEYVARHMFLSHGNTANCSRWFNRMEPYPKVPKLLSELQNELAESDKPILQRLNFEDPIESQDIFEQVQKELRTLKYTSESWVYSINLTLFDQAAQIPAGQLPVTIVLAESTWKNHYHWVRPTDDRDDLLPANQHAKLDQMMVVDVAFIKKTMFRFEERFSQSIVQRLRGSKIQSPHLQRKFIKKHFCTRQGSAKILYNLNCGLRRLLWFAIDFTLRITHYNLTAAVWCDIYIHKLCELYTCSMWLYYVTYCIYLNYVYWSKLMCIMTGSRLPFRISQHCVILFSNRRAWFCLVLIRKSALWFVSVPENAIPTVPELEARNSVRSRSGSAQFCLFLIAKSEILPVQKPEQLNFVCSETGTAQFRLFRNRNSTILSVPKPVQHNFVWSESGTAQFCLFRNRNSSILFVQM